MSAKHPFRDARIDALLALARNPSTVSPPTSGELLIWRPGVASADNHVETWEEVAAAITASTGALNVQVDTTIAAAQVPAGTTDVNGVRFYARIQGMEVELLDGAIWHNLVYAWGIVLVFDAITTSPLSFDDQHRVVFDMGFFLNGASAAVPAATMPGGGAQTFQLFRGCASGLSHPFMDVPAGSTATPIFESTIGPIPPAFYSGAGSVIATLDSDYTIPIGAPIFDATTIASQARSSFQSALQPSATSTAGRPTNVATGQMNFDTTLGKPIWWNGSAWVDATGTPV